MKVSSKSHWKMVFEDSDNNLPKLRLTHFAKTGKGTADWYKEHKTIGVMGQAATAVKSVTRYKFHISTPLLELYSWNNWHNLKS